MRLKFYKQSTEKFVSRIDPEAFSATRSRVIFPVACHLRIKSLATKRGEEFQFAVRTIFKTVESFSYVSLFSAEVGWNFTPVQRVPFKYRSEVIVFL